MSVFAQPSSLALTLAQALCAIGVGVWGAILLAPAPGYPPPALATASAAGSDTALVAAWFGGAQARVRVDVLGLISGADGYGAALLSVDGAAPRAFRAGEELVPGVILERVHAGGVRIAQDGEAHEVAAPADKRTVLRGIVPVGTGGPTTTGVR